MQLRTWLILGGVLVSGAFLLGTRGASPSPPAQAPTVKALPSVRIEHEYVTLSTPAPAPPQLARVRYVRAPAGAQEPSSPVPPPIRAARNRGLLERARHAFVGDGRHKPEPFPRIKEH